MTLSIEERVDNIERYGLYSFLAVCSFIGITQNKGYLLGINLTIFYLIAFFISFPLAIYYIFKVGFIVGGRYGESSNRFYIKYKSKIDLPAKIIFVIFGVLIMYSWGQDLKTIGSSIVGAIVIEVIFKLKK